MFGEIFRFELRYRLKRPATYIYFGLMFLMAFLLMLALGGLFGGGIVVGDAAGGKVLANSPYQINWLLTAISMFGVFVTSAIMGTPVFRDFEHRTHSLYYTAPISKLGYLGGRFLGSFVVLLLVFAGAGLGAWLATYWPGLDEAKIGPNHAAAYLQPYLTIIIPNLLFTGAIFFTGATLTRSALAVYLGGIGFFVLYSISQTLQQDIDNDTLQNLLDPMGGGAVYLTQRYWTVAERNAMLLPWSDYLVQNRLLWMAISLLMLAACYFVFRFSFANASASGPRPKAGALGVADAPKGLQLPRITPRFTAGLAWAQFGRLLRLEFLSTVRSVYFMGIAGAGVLFLVIAGMQVGQMFGTNTYPVTPVVVQVLGGSFSLFMLIIITFYSGELVWRERDSQIHQIYDAMPMPGWVPFSAKLGALMLIQVVLLVVVLVCGVTLQTFKGYFNYEIDVYLKELFGFQLLDFWIMCVLAMLVQVLCNNKYMGHFIMILYYAFNLFKGQLGLEHNLYSFNSDPGVRYSAMNGYGHFVWPYFAFKLYWGAFAVLLALASSLLWPRGTETRFSWRWAQARSSMSPALRGVAGVALLVFAGMGGYIFYNTNVLNEYRTSDETEELQAQYEREFKRFEKRPQPRITAVNIEADIYPAERDVHFKGTYWLLNREKVAIDSVQLLHESDAEVKRLELARPAKEVLNKKLGEVVYRIVRLQQPLQPGDSVQLHFDMAYTNPGFRNRGSNTSMVYNGTFVGTQLLPHIGYQDGLELGDDDLRKDQGLQPKPRMASVHDSAARMNTYISNEADWIRFETTVSTSPDQIAIAPGYLQKEWTKDGRRYFHYKMDAPILNFYSFLSARYAVYKDKWKDIPIEIYYQPGHEYNLKRMVKGVQKGLEYYTANFGPYQHRQVRILEFPGYSSFAQAFPNTIPFSESIGFVAHVDSTDPKDIDYPLYVTAHEVAHQWFAHQIIGGNVQGGTLMSETLSQYSALMVMKHIYGEEKMKKFLKYELNSYLTGRTTERKKEVPLYLVENQPYIHYRKGSVVMYALQDYLGEKAVNAAIKEYRDKVAYQRAPYTTSVEFLGYIRKHTPDSLQYLVTDLFERITLYENKVDSASYRKLPNGQYKVQFTVNTKKLYADSLGNETPDLKARDFIDVGVITRKKGKDGKYQDVPMLLEKRRLVPGLNRLEFTVPQKPDRVGIDPFNKLIDRNPDDNVKAPEEKKA
ncbi:ABC transporter permease/M1 family aminopeptidase [Hymenobacter latericus]|uniref:ABC transporter permease/M1 family aminopeptidase n=1 Tax=Hymenobacter sp. YIM 151858-1 TaxID=2987688 RepID=UPI002227C5FF|nr:M1 family aminopeptidase [Hymenobacter sp. YIM 151858-1]UYZ57706.1 M1 family aminopeptidase [Hymenobacter sp. YIM 151858-1]